MSESERMSGWRHYLSAEVRRLALLQLPRMAASEYDAAWLSRLESVPGQASYPELVPWLLSRQHADGSWGGAAFFLPDRLLTTLSVVTALGNRSDSARRAVEAGVRFVRERASQLKEDGDLTVGFELLVPAYLGEARKLGLGLDAVSWGFVEQAARRKRSHISDHRLLAPGNDSRLPENTALFSLEAFIGDLTGLEQAAPRLLRRDGSVWTSPSATAALMSRIPDWSRRYPGTRGYLDSVVTASGGAPPHFAPYELMMRGWIAYYLYHGGCWGEHAREVRPHLEHLRACWGPDGIGLDEGIPTDADDSAMAIFLLFKFGEPLSGEPLLAFERDDRFLDYLYGGDSISTNLHVLEASAAFPEKDRERIRRKVLDYALERRGFEGYWRDRWNVSPHYATSNALIAMGPLAPAQMRVSLDWVLRTQHDGGGWGWLGEPTREETAMELLALVSARRSWAKDIPVEVLHRAALFVARHESGGYDDPPLWKSKVLYSPVPFTRAVVLGALSAYLTDHGERHLPPAPATGSF